MSREEVQNDLFMDFEEFVDDDGDDEEEETDSEKGSVSESEHDFTGEDDGEIGEVDLVLDQHQQGQGEFADSPPAGGRHRAAGIVLPYRHEPPPRDDGENYGDAPRRDVDPQRLQDTDWCRCGGHCVVLPSFNEGDCICCQEIEEVTQEGERQKVQCITLAESFNSAILDPVSLYIGWLHYTEKWRRQARSFQERNNEKYRYVAYRNFVRWCWGYLGRDIRVQLPACVQAKIKNTYPDGLGRYRGTILRRLHHNL